MEEKYEGESLKTKLIIAGIAEIETHGIADFSLRRVAQACGASCAAPYRHFDGKNGFILEIILYIDRQWALLESQLIEIYGGDTRTLLVELCMAYIRFGLANPDARAVLLLDKHGMDDAQKKALGQLTEKTAALIDDYCRQKGLTAQLARQKLFQVRSMLYGAVIMTDSGEMQNTDETMRMVRRCIENVIDGVA